MTTKSLYFPVIEEYNVDTDACAINEPSAPSASGEVMDIARQAASSELLNFIEALLVSNSPAMRKAVYPIAARLRKLALGEDAVMIFEQEYITQKIKDLKDIWTVDEHGAEVEKVVNPFECLAKAIVDTATLSEKIKGLLKTDNRHGDLRVSLSAALRIEENIRHMIDVELGYIKDTKASR